jgi:hypothetical protein
MKVLDNILYITYNILYIIIIYIINIYIILYTCPITFSENRAVYEVMLENVVKPQMTI